MICICYCLFSGSCAPENVINITTSRVLATSQSSLCLACLFSGQGAQPGTVWLLNGQNPNNTFGIAEVNNNGTLIVRPPQGLNGTLSLNCQLGGNSFSITLIGELCTAAHCGMSMNHYVSLVSTPNRSIVSWKSRLVSY